MTENVLWELHEGRMLFEKSEKEQGFKNGVKFTLGPLPFFLVGPRKVRSYCRLQLFGD